MLASLLSPKLLLLCAFVASAAYVHFRGRVRHRFFRQLTDHSTLLAPYNVLMYACSAVPNRPYLDLAAFPELAPLADPWRTIRDEAVLLLSGGHIRAPDGHTDIGFHSFFKGGYRRFYLKWYDAPPPSALALCPRTVALIEAIPSVQAAMFALLPPGAKLGAHRDPYAGSLRYHLGLATPNAATCGIVVDGEPYHWRDGEAVLFDETYIHSAENASDATRLILFCDVERPLTPRFVAWINRGFRNAVMRASQTANVAGEKVGLVNRIFSRVYRARLLGKRIKEKSRLAYYAIKWLLIGAVLAGIYFL
jgi:beta-hydroxylase